MITGKLEEVKAKLREAEDELFKALAGKFSMGIKLEIYCVVNMKVQIFDFLLSICFVAKNRKEARRMALMEAIAAKKARTEEIKRKVQDQRAKRDEYAAFLSHQSFGNFI